MQFLIDKHILAINIPHKLNEFIGIKYKDVFDEYDNPKPIALDLGRFHKDRVIEIPLKTVVKDTLLAYVRYLGWRYDTNADNALFESRQHQIMASRTCWRIIKDTASAVGIKKNIGVESLRKTYGYNIYSRAEDKLNAILFLGEVWGQVRDATIIRYLNLTVGEVDFDYYLGETFSIGDVDLSQIKCIPTVSPILQSSPNIMQTAKNKQIVVEQLLPEEKPKSEPKTKSNRLWPKEKKLEVVRKYLEQHISQKELSAEYEVDQSNISHWVSTYKRFGESAFEDKRFKPKK